MKHYNPSIAEDATRIFNLKNGDMMPEEIGEPVAVIPIEHKCDFGAFNNRNASGDGNILTVSADKDTYITNVCYHLAKTATCDVATALCPTVICQVNGVGRRLVSIGVITLTASDTVVNASFNPPVKVDRNTTIIHGGTVTYAAGTMLRTATIVGYTVETTKGV